jgi:hypothetical protein
MRSVTFVAAVASAVLATAVPSFAQSRVTVGADITFSPATSDTKDTADLLGLPLSGVNTAYSASILVRVAGQVSVGVRQGLYGVDLVNGLAKYRSRSIDISAGLDVLKDSRISMVLLGGPTIFHETGEVFGVSLPSETGLGFHVGSDVTYYMGKVVGVGGTVIYNQGGDGAGFTRYGGGVRFRF